MDENYLFDDLLYFPFKFQVTELKKMQILVDNIDGTYDGLAALYHFVGTKSNSPYFFSCQISDVVHAVSHKDCPVYDIVERIVAIIIDC